MLTFHQVMPTPDWWAKGKEYADRTVFHTEQWMGYIAETHPDATPSIRGHL